jgi:uncharacterized Tic20 family protein
MDNVTTLTPNQNERVMAALSHVSVILPFMGVIAPLVIWITQKEKSLYVAFQASQALAYQLMMILAGFVETGCYLVFFLVYFLVVVLISPDEPSHTMDPVSVMVVFMPFIIMGILFLARIVLLIYGLVGAVMTYQGKPFRYIFIGNRVERFVQ